MSETEPTHQNDILDVNDYLREAYNLKMLAIEPYFFARASGVTGAEVGDFVLIFQGTETTEYDEFSETESKLYCAAPSIQLMRHLYENGIHELYGVGLVFRGTGTTRYLQVLVNSSVVTFPDIRNVPF